LSLSAILLSILFFVISFVRDCQQESKIEENQKLNKALEFRPILIVNKEPIIKSNRLYQSSESIAEQINKQLQSSGLKLEYNLGLNLEYQLKNVGNSIADIVFIAQIDSVPEKEYLGNLIVENFGDKTDTLKIVKPLIDYLQIRPGDTLILPLEYRVGATFNKKARLHTVFIYEGESKAVYLTSFTCDYLIEIPNDLLKTKDKKLFYQHEYNNRLSVKLTNMNQYSKILEGDMTDELFKISSYYLQQLNKNK
jgi:hypothetical protein